MQREDYLEPCYQAYYLGSGRMPLQVCNIAYILHLF